MRLRSQCLCFACLMSLLLNGCGVQGNATPVGGSSIRTTPDTVVFSLEETENGVPTIELPVAPGLAITPTIIPTPQFSPPFRETALVVRVIDGDSIEVELNDQRCLVRYIGVDAFEEQGDELGAQAGDATSANRNLVAGRVVELERDISDADDGGQLLRYVYVGEVLVNAELARLGVAAVILMPPDVRHQDILLAAQSQARAAGRGFWVPPLPVVLEPQLAKGLPTAQSTATVVATELPERTPVPSVQVTAWVSQTAPAQRTSVTVYGQITVDGKAVAGVPMRTTWHFKSKDSTCEGVSTSEGIADCTRNIGGATLGYAVVISVEMTHAEQVYATETVFTPQ